MQISQFSYELHVLSFKKKKTTKSFTDLLDFCFMEFILIYLSVIIH